MKERPILFSGAMVRAILGGQKTVTRRVMKLQPDFLGSMTDANTPFKTMGAGLHGQIVCPYGQPGDRLWVREAWHVGKPHDKTKPADILLSALAKDQGVTVIYDAGGWMSIGPACREEPIYPDDQPMPDWAGRGRPSIHMPRAFCRILLEITAVRVERLQGISEEQARAEGMERDSDGWIDYLMPSTQRCTSAFESFRTLWSSINGTESWHANPWVWVVEFKRVAA